MRGPKEYFFSLPTGGAGTGTPCGFNGRSNVVYTGSQMTATELLTGAAGAVVTIQLTTVSSTNPSGYVSVNSTVYYLNQSFTVTLDGTGNGSFNVLLYGDPSANGTVVRVVFTITSVTIGQINMSNNSVQESKVF